MSLAKTIRRPLFYIPVIFVVLLALLVLFVYLPHGKAPAVLYVNAGTVEVDTGAGYMTATDGMRLKEGASVRTGQGGKATVVLYETAIVTLQEETEASIAALAKTKQVMRQEHGTVWNKVARLGGKEEYSIQTPTTTATVRGTSFRTFWRDGVFSMFVIEGEVEVTNEDGAVLIAKAFEVIEEKDGVLTKRAATPEDLADVKEELTHEIDILRRLRLGEVYKNAAAVSYAKRQYGVTDEGIAQFLVDIDDGKRTEDVIREKAPQTPSVETVLAYNAEIRKTLLLMQKI
jgi:hypothetical protein